MKIIESVEINQTELAKLLARANHGSTDRDICYNTVTGEIADLHNTNQRGDWVVLIDLYNTTYDGVETYSVDDWAELLSDTGVESIEITRDTGKTSYGLPDYEQIELQIVLV